MFYQINLLNLVVGLGGLQKSLTNLCLQWVHFFLHSNFLGFHAIWNTRICCARGGFAQWGDSSNCFFMFHQQLRLDNWLVSLNNHKCSSNWGLFKCRLQKSWSIGKTSHQRTSMGLGCCSRMLMPTPPIHRERLPWTLPKRSTASEKRPVSQHPEQIRSESQAIHFTPLYLTNLKVEGQGWILSLVASCWVSKRYNVNSDFHFFCHVLPLKNMFK